jgi:hypothetical protein
MFSRDQLKRAALEPWSSRRNDLLIVSIPFDLAA